MDSMDFPGLGKCSGFKGGDGGALSISGCMIVLCGKKEK